MNRPVLHQFIESFSAGDAVSDHARLLQRWLRDLGFESQIYAVSFNAAVTDDVRSAAVYRRSRHESHIIYHHAAGATIVERLIEQPLPLILVYHNITPPEFFARNNPALASLLKLGLQQLTQLQPRTALALGVSHFNEQALLQYGFNPTGVVPIVLDDASYQLPSNIRLQQALQHKHPNLLFVGRITPNKRQEDLIKLLYYYRRIQPNAHLTLVGKPHLDGYQRWLQELIVSHNLESHITFTGHTSFQDMVTLYQAADLFVSMSEHEGFGKPLIESMYFNLPILAYASTAIPYTLGDAGVLFHHKDFEALAELVDLMIADQALRRKVIGGQQRRLKLFLEPQVRQKWIGYLRLMDIIRE